MKQKAGEGDVKDKIDKHLTSLRGKKEMKERVGRNSKNHETMNNYIPTNSVTENIEKFIETYSLLRLNHEETENLNKPIMSKEI